MNDLLELLQYIEKLTSEALSRAEANVAETQKILKQLGGKHE